MSLRCSSLFTMRHPSCSDNQIPFSHLTLFRWPDHLSWTDKENGYRSSTQVAAGPHLSPLGSHRVALPSRGDQPLALSHPSCGNFRIATDFRFICYAMPSGLWRWRFSPSALFCPSVNNLPRKEWYDRLWNTLSLAGLGDGASKDFSILPYSISCYLLF